MADDIRLYMGDVNNVQDGLWHPMGTHVDELPNRDSQPLDRTVATLEFDVIASLNGVAAPLIPVAGMEVVYMLFNPTNRLLNKFFFAGKVSEVHEGNSDFPTTILYTVKCEGYDRELSMPLRDLEWIYDYVPLVGLPVLNDSARIKFLIEQSQAIVPGVWDGETHVDQGPTAEGFVTFTDTVSEGSTTVYDAITKIADWEGTESTPVIPRKWYVTGEFTTPAANPPISPTATFPAYGVSAIWVVRYINYYFRDELDPGAGAFAPYALSDIYDPTPPIPTMIYVEGWTKSGDATGMANWVAVEGPPAGITDVTWDEEMTQGMRMWAGKLAKGEVLPRWEPNHDYVITDNLMPTIANGYYYTPQNEGTSAAAIDEDADPDEDYSQDAGEPSWPTVVGATVTDTPDNPDLTPIVWEAFKFQNAWTAGALSTQMIQDGDWNVQFTVERDLMAFDAPNREDSDWLEKLEFPEFDGKWHYIGDPVFTQNADQWGIRSNQFAPMGERDGTGDERYSIFYFQTKTIVPEGMPNVTVEVMFSNLRDLDGDVIENMVLVGRLAGGDDFWYVRPYFTSSSDQGYKLGKRQAGTNTDLVTYNVQDIGDEDGPQNEDTLSLDMSGSTYKLFLKRRDRSQVLLTYVSGGVQTEYVDPTDFLSPLAADYSGHKHGAGIDQTGGRAAWYKARFSNFALYSGESYGETVSGFGREQVPPEVFPIVDQDDVQFSIYRRDDQTAVIRENGVVLGAVSPGPSASIPYERGTVFKIALRWSQDANGYMFPWIQYQYKQPADSGFTIWHNNLFAFTAGVDYILGESTLTEPLFIAANFYTVNAVLSDITLRRSMAYNEFSDATSIQRHGIWPAPEILRSEDYNTYQRRKNAAMKYLREMSLPKDVFMAQVPWPVELPVDQNPFPPGWWVSVSNVLKGWVLETRLIQKSERSWEWRHDPITGVMTPFPVYNLELGPKPRDWTTDSQSTARIGKPSKPTNFRLTHSSSESETSSYLAMRWDIPDENLAYIEVEVRPARATPNAKPESHFFVPYAGSGSVHALPPSTPHTVKARKVGKDGQVSDWTDEDTISTARADNDYINHKVNVGNKIMALRDSDGISTATYHVPPDLSEVRNPPVNNPQVYIKRTRVALKSPMQYQGDDVVLGERIAPTATKGFVFLPTMSTVPTVAPDKMYDPSPTIDPADPQAPTPVVPVQDPADPTRTRLYAYNYAANAGAGEWQEISGSGGGGVGVWEHFDGASGPLTTAGSGQTWQALGGVWSLDGNQGLVTADGGWFGDADYYIEAGISNGFASAEIVESEGGGFAEVLLGVRARPRPDVGTNRWDGIIGEAYVDFALETTTFYISDAGTGGAIVVAYNVPTPSPAGKKISIIFIDKQISILFDGITVLTTYADQYLENTGFVLSAYEGDRVDNVYVYSGNSQGNMHYIGYVHAPGGAVTTGIKPAFIIPYNDFVITAWELQADQAGSLVLSLWGDIPANYPPVVGDSLTPTNPPTLSTDDRASGDTIGWLNEASVPTDIIVNVDSVSGGIQWFTLTLTIASRVS